MVGASRQAQAHRRRSLRLGAEQQSAQAAAGLRAVRLPPFPLFASPVARGAWRAAAALWGAPPSPSPAPLRGTLPIGVFFFFCARTKCDSGARTRAGGRCVCGGGKGAQLPPRARLAYHHARRRAPRAAHPTFRRPSNVLHCLVAARCRASLGRVRGPTPALAGPVVSQSTDEGALARAQVLAMPAFDADVGAGAGGASAESARKALLLATQAMGVDAATVRGACVERDAARAELDLALDRLSTHSGGGELLVRAARSGKEYALRHALSRGASVHFVDAKTYTIRGETALHIATQGGFAGCVRLLLEAGADPDREDGFYQGAAHRAVEHGHADILRVLLEAGADKDKAGMGGNTLMHDAVVYGKPDCLRVLLEAGADIAIARSSGFTASSFAASWGHSDCLQMLLEAGANKDHADICNRTLVMLAATEGHTSCVRLLLEAGADAARPDNVGITPLAAAEEDGHQETAALLREHFACGAP